MIKYGLYNNNYIIINLKDLNYCKMKFFINNIIISGNLKFDNDLKLYWLILPNLIYYFKK